MRSRRAYEDHVDPEYQRWGRQYPRFPGVAECARLIEAGKARGAWADIIVHQLAENAGTYLADLIEAFRSDSRGSVRHFVMIALDVARIPKSVPFLADVLLEGDVRFRPYAVAALRGIDTRESRTVLWNQAQSPNG